VIAVRLSAEFEAASVERTPAEHGLMRRGLNAANRLRERSILVYEAETVAEKRKKTALCVKCK
jgi:hypothetical protein